MTPNNIYESGKGVKTGYFITLDQLVELCTDFQIDFENGIVKNDKYAEYIENKIKEMP